MTKVLNEHNLKCQQLVGGEVYIFKPVSKHQISVPTSKQSIIFLGAAIKKRKLIPLREALKKLFA